MMRIGTNNNARSAFSLEFIIIEYRMTTRLPRVPFLKSPKSTKRKISFRYFIPIVNLVNFGFTFRHSNSQIIIFNLQNNYLRIEYENLQLVGALTSHTRFALRARSWSPDIVRSTQNQYFATYSQLFASQFSEFATIDMYCSKNDLPKRGQLFT